MGLLINGKWDAEADNTAFEKKMDEFHDKVTADGSSGFKAEKDRYHLYISLACPWACRALIFWKLKKLEKVISISIVDAIKKNNTWFFSDAKGSIPDTVNHANFLYEIYLKAKPGMTGRVSVPVLWDKKTKTIVNNESSEIIRMLNSEFDTFTDVTLDFYPMSLRADIDAINEKIFNAVNLGVYKCGFAKNQADYDNAFDALFKTLDKLEEHLSQSRYLVGNTLTEADWRLFTTLVRFDAVYYIHFKCSLHRIIDYPNLINYLRELYQYSGIAETVNFDHIKRHYYLSHSHINPSGIVPKGPIIDLNLPHNRK